MVVEIFAQPQFHFFLVDCGMMGMKTVCFYHLYLHHKDQRATEHSSLQTEYTWAQKMPFISKTRANLEKLISFLESAALNSFQHSWHKRKKNFCCAVLLIQAKNVYSKLTCRKNIKL